MDGKTLFFHNIIKLEFAHINKMDDAVSKVFIVPPSSACSPCFN